MKLHRMTFLKLILKNKITEYKISMQKFKKEFEKN